MEQNDKIIEDQNSEVKEVFEVCPEIEDYFGYYGVFDECEECTIKNKCMAWGKKIKQSIED